MTITRTPERAEFLSNVLTTALEHAGYGFPGILEYPDVENPADVYAVIYDRYEEESGGTDDWRPSQTWRVDVDTIAHGLGVLKEKYRPGGHLRELFAADRDNDAGDIDVVGALAILEAALFGDITYN